MSSKKITAKVLEALFNVAEDFADVAVNRDSAWRVLYQIDKEYEWTKTKLGRWIQDLKREGFVKVCEKNGKESIVITNKGKIKIVESITGSREKDKKNRFISFDIPEYMKSQRDGFRKVIKRLGFKQVQQSLWVINKDVSDLVEIAELEYGVSDYVVYIVSESSDADKYISGLFKPEKNNDGRVVLS